VRFREIYVINEDDVNYWRN